MGKFTALNYVMGDCVTKFILDKNFLSYTYLVTPKLPLENHTKYQKISDFS